MWKRASASIAITGLALLGCASGGEVKKAEVTYQDLVRYEGKYEYENGLTLEIAASPREKILYALISDAKYPLRPAGEDTFLNVANERVLFTEQGGEVAGFMLPDTRSDRLFKRLSKDVRFPVEMWYPRMTQSPGGGSITLAVPQDRGDGLAVGPLQGSGLDVARIEEMVRQIAAGRYPDVHSVLILKKGALVVEEYFYEYTADTVHPLRSATKSFISALAGLAIEDGLIQGVREPVLPFFADEYPQIENLNDSKRKLTIEDLLTQRSGFDCDDWKPDSVGNESRIAQLDDWVKAFLDLPTLHEPGTVASYCSAGVITLGRIVEKKAKIPLEKYAERRLFEPLGIRSYHWRFDPDRSSSETFIQLSLRPRDMAKFGLLYQRGGQWGGRQVVPAEWVAASIAKHSTVGDTDYGYLWWRPYLNTPGGVHHGIMATGNGGQKIFLWPELDMIVVFTGGNYNIDSPTNELLINFILPETTVL